jgi:hypothetical protein
LAQTDHFGSSCRALCAVDAKWLAWRLRMLMGRLRFPT